MSTPQSSSCRARWTGSPISAPEHADVVFHRLRGAAAGILLIVSGVAIKRWLVTDPGHWVGIERLVYYVLFPALLINTLAHADLSRVPVGQVAARSC